MSCDDLNDLILFYAGGVAEEAEVREVLHHLGKGCPRCAGRLAESRAVIAPLSLAVESAQPSPQVRDRLMARVSASGASEAGTLLPGSTERGVASDGGSSRERGPLEMPSRRAPAAAESGRPSVGYPRPVVAGRSTPNAEPPLDSSSRFVRTWVVPGLAAALAAAFAGLAVYTPMHREHLAMEARLAQQDGRLRILQADVEKAKRTLDLLRSPAVLVVSLKGAEAPRGAGRILWDTSRKTWHFYAADLVPLGPDRTYQLWFITADKKMVSAGTFDVDPAGQGELVANVPEGLTPIALAAVTDEPAGGMPQPTGKIQIKGEVPTT